MKQVQVTAPDQAEVVEAAEPTPADGEALLELHSAGICGGDLSLVAGTNAVARYPAVPGHECVARVLRAPDSAGLVEGSYVVVYPTLSCGSCRVCAAGRTNQCTQMSVLGVSADGGCFADRFAVPVEQCLPLADDLAARYGALVEPLAVGCHVVSRGEVRTSDTALVIGSGTIGTCTALVARTRGVDRILFADLHASRAEVLANLGFTEFTTAAGDELTAWVTERTGRVDLVYDTVTTTATANVAADALAAGGRYVAIAAANPGHRLDLSYEPFYARELAMIACRNYGRADFHAAIQLLADGSADPRPVRSGVFSLTDFPAAVAALTECPQDHMKILLTRAELVDSSELLGTGGGA